MNHIRTLAIVLSRTDFGEADRILTLLTPEYGKLRLMARGVRKERSKLAGGIELFTIADISYLPGRGEVGTLTSARMKQHYGRIVEDINRVQLGYLLMKILNRATEDQPESGYFNLLHDSLKALNTPSVSLMLIKTWFEAGMLRLAGHSPNLKTDESAQPLVMSSLYTFEASNGTFQVSGSGHFSSDHIKLLRLLFGQVSPEVLQKVQGIDGLLPDCEQLLESMLKAHIRI